jgi:hypothetical protein
MNGASIVDFTAYENLRLESVYILTNLCAWLDDDLFTGTGGINFKRVIQATPPK